MMESIKVFLEIFSMYQGILDGLKQVKQELQKISQGLKDIQEIISLIKSVSQQIKDLSKQVICFLRKKINLLRCRQMSMRTNTPELSFTFPNSFIENISIDEEISKELKQQNFCYVLSSPKYIRQLVLLKIKTSLTAVAGECQVTIIEPGLFSNSEEALWYGKFIDKINQDLNLNCTTREWIGQNRDMQNEPNKLFEKYIEEKIITRMQDTNIVIIINEVCEIFKSLSFRTRFFSSIDKCYSQRTINEKYKKLNFLLLGSADTSIDNIAPDAAAAIMDAEMGIENSTESYITVGWCANRENIMQPKIQIIKSKREDFWGNINVDQILSDIWESTDGNPLWTQEVFQQLIRKKSLITPEKEANFVQKEIADLVSIN